MRIHEPPAECLSRRRRGGYSRIAILIAVLSIMACEGAWASGRDKEPFRGDTRLQQRLIVRVSRMPIADLLQRVSAELGVPLSVEGGDVADQKIDLFTHGEVVSAAEILTAITDLLNEQSPPRSYHWERFGQAPGYRYAVVRDVASRQWELQHAAAAEARMPAVLQQRFAALGREPYRPESADRTELPSMRKLLLLLTREQFAQLCANRSLNLKPEECTPAERQLLRQLVREAVADERRRDPQFVEESLARSGPLEKFEGGGMGILLKGDAPRYTIEVGVTGPHPLGQLGRVGDAVDKEALAGSRLGTASRAPALAPGTPDLAFALPARTSWLMGDVLADLAARAKVNLIADDYTQDWSGLGPSGAARPLSRWLAMIRDECGFEPTPDGKFLRLRNRVWWLDAKREIPMRLLTRWKSLLQGTNADRLQVVLELASVAPYSRTPRLESDRLRILEQSPELARTLRQDGPQNVPSLISIVSLRHVELLVYDRLPVEKRRQVFGSGLVIRGSEFPQDLGELLKERLDDKESLPRRSLFMRYSGDRLQMNWDARGMTSGSQMEVILPAEPTDDPQQLVGQFLPDLEVEGASGKTTSFRLTGPALLYVTPAWPRPVVTVQEDFADLKAIERMPGLRPQVLGTEAAATEVRDWWKERGLAAPPLALRPASAQRLGVRHVPLAIVVDRAGRVVWVREGYLSVPERAQLEGRFFKASSSASSRSGC
jgi:hypothetical protein